MVYCRSEVRRYDPDRYFSSLFAGEEGSRSLQALYAFNLEIAKTRETVSEVMLGRIRLQWWREAIDGIYEGTPRNHAVVTALAHAVETHGLERSGFERIIDGREFDLEDREPHTTTELVDYAAKTSGALTCLTLACFGATGREIEDFGRDAGIAWALTGLLLSVPFHASQERCFLPRDLMEQHEMMPRALYRGQSIDGLKMIVAEIAETAKEKLTLAREQRGVLPRSAARALSHLSVAAANLHRLEKGGHDIFAFRPLSPLRRQWRVTSAALRKQF
ncbi:MAG: squalene/phytoene synthase family protein [Rhodospirillaceae bacterium]|jgi:NADH dehydrogenase [ubiquinone] 1 alpha subcomplex assembly factor 6|nr:squalene/phytoene synthase family protein [Rhodospirillaceae bacterium]